MCEKAISFGLNDAPAVPPHGNLGLVCPYRPSMTDPISIVSLVAIVIKASKVLCQLIDDTKNAPREVLEVSQDSRATYEILGKLEGFLQHNDKDPVPSELFRSLQIPLDNTHEVLTDLAKKLKPYIKSSGNAKQSKWVGFKWAVNQREVRSLKESLVNGKSTLSMTLAVVTT